VLKHYIQVTVHRNRLHF